MVTSGGDIAIVGLAGGTLSAGFGTVPFESRVIVPFWGTRSELCEVIALARDGRIRAHVERFQLDDVQRAYNNLRAGIVTVAPWCYRGVSQRERFAF